MTRQLPRAEPLSLETVAAIQARYDEGLALSAYTLGRAHAPLELWQPVEAQLLAGRLAMHLGAPRLAHWLLRCAYRAAPERADTRYYYGYRLWSVRGAYAAWRWIHRVGELPADTTPDLRSSWYALLGSVASALRDFDTAETWLARARAVAPESAWVRVCQAEFLEAQDGYDEALAVAQEALDQNPRYRPAVHTVGHLLTLLGRDAEALALLREANTRLEQPSIAGQLFLLELELRDYAAAAQTLDRFVALSPVLEKAGRQWVASSRAELCYHLGDIPGVIQHARESDSEYWKAIATRLESAPDAPPREVTLNVGFVRQHHMTCVPATLTAISRYWSMPADHLQVADEICYCGTSHHNERKWATDHGWLAREFSVTEESAMALLDRGVPFTFTTVNPGNSHLQAIIGYDARRGTLSVRDPYFRNSGEALAGKLLAHYRAYGPRGMALVPLAERARLEGLELPDAALWDQLHALDAALVAHRREAAAEILARLAAEAPGHRLTLEARRRLAIYDSNPAEHLAAVEALVALFPDDQALQHERLALLRDQSQRAQRLAIYEALLRKPETHPIFWQQYAQELRIDARRHDDAVWLLKRAIRRWPGEAAGYLILAHIYWDQRRFAEALELYRFAACLAERDESIAQSYFTAAGWLHQTERVLEMLRDRVGRFGKKSSQPAITLASALTQLDRNGEALAVLNEAIRTHPADGHLLLVAADMHAATSTENLARTRELIELARDKAPRSHWLRALARLKRSEGDLAGALALWREVLALQPLAIDAHRAVARLLAETESPAAALAHLEAAARRFPHLHPLHQLWAEWVRDEPADIRELVLRRVAEAFPHDAWARRELGFLLAATGRLDEAWQECEAAAHLEPAVPPAYHLRAEILRQSGRDDEARAALRTAIELSVDNDFAIAELMQLAPTLAERRATLRFVKEQLVKQVTFGDGLLSYRQHARGTLEPDELAADLREALAARPDLWHAWSALVQHLLVMDERDEAWRLVQQATERFPLLPRLWLDRAAVCRARHDAPGELEALRTAYHIHPGWGTAVSALADALERRGEYDEARALLERAVAHDPLDGYLRQLWAEALWRAGQREAAIAQVQQVAQLEPGQERPWECLSTWCAEQGCPERALETARELTRRRAGETRSWLVLARLLDRPEQFEERLAALDKAIELNPRSIDAHDQRAMALAQAGRWDEARAACAPTALGPHLPRELRWRAAWLTAQRGDLAAAVAAMRQLVSEEPHYYPAWSQLADWYRELGDVANYREAAEALVRLSPQYEVTHGYLGEACQMAGDRAAAREAYSHAFAINPQYEFAGLSLFDLALEDGDLAAAEATLRTLEAHSDTEFVLARAVQLAARQKATERAAQALERIATMNSRSNWPLDAAVEALLGTHQGVVARDVLQRVLENPAADPQVGRQWVRVERAVGIRGWETRLPELVAKSRPVGEQAVYAYLDALLLAGQVQELRTYIRHNERWLAQHDYPWGAVGYALANLRDYQATIRWMNDWQQRLGAEPWMLLHLVEALRALRRDAEATAVSRAALACAREDSKDYHRLWLAADAVAAGDLAAARTALEGTSLVGMAPSFGLLRASVLGALEIDAAPIEERPARFCEVRRRIAEAWRQHPAVDHEPAHKRIWRAAARQITRRVASWPARLWYAWVWVRSRLAVS